MSKLQLLSLGGWCRPAFQLHRFCEGREATMTPLRGPFDWTVTPIAALQACLAPGFVPQSVLQPGLCHVSVVGSGACSTTGVIFHHRLEQEKLKELGHVVPGATIPPSPAFDEMAQDARGRFAHTFRQMSALKDHDGGILFVRWRRGGDPDHHVPDAFAGETDAQLMTLIETFLGHARFHLLVVQSRVTRDRTEPFETPIISIAREGRAISCLLRERAGWNGDQTPNFKGDDHSWQAALQAATDMIAASTVP